MCLERLLTLPLLRWTGPSQFDVFFSDGGTHRFHLRETNTVNLVGKENECCNFGGNYCFLFTLDLW